MKRLNNCVFKYTTDILLLLESPPLPKNKNNKKSLRTKIETVALFIGENIFCCFFKFVLGVLLAVFEKAGAIRTYHNISAGTIAAGYQNFVVCIEMFFASIALRYAFPFSIYRHQRKLDERGQGIALKSISRNLRQTINPKDIVDDAIHNFSRSYQHYANAQNLKNFNEESVYNEESVIPGNNVTSYRSTVVDNLDSIRPGMQVTVLDNHGYRYDNDTNTLLDSDDEF